MDIEVNVKPVEFGSLKGLAVLNIEGIEIRGFKIIDSGHGTRRVTPPSRDITLNGRHESYEVVRFTTETMRQEVESRILGAYDGAVGNPPSPPSPTKASPKVEIPKECVSILLALKAARVWAAEHAAKSASAGAALAYIDAIPQALREGDEGAKVQFLYILSNLSGWRGDEARKAKEIIKKASK